MRINQSTQSRITDRQIREAHPGLSFGPHSDLSEHGYPTLENTPQPDPIDAEHRVTPGPDEEYAPGQWRQTWVQEPIPEPPVPESVEALYALLAIDDLGYTQMYETWASDPARTFKEKAFIDKAGHWRRDDVYFNAAADDMGLGETDKDAFFRHADSLRR